MINLLPYSEKKDVERMRVLRIVSSALGFLIVLALLLCLLLTPTISTINSRYTLWQGEITRLEHAGVAVSSETIAQSESRAALLKKGFTANATLSPIDAIAVAEGVVPSGVTLSGFSFVAGVENTLSVQGVVTTREVLQMYADALQKQSTVAMVDNPVTNYLKQRDNEFTLTITFK